MIEIENWRLDLEIKFKDYRISVEQKQTADDLRFKNFVEHCEVQFRECAPLCLMSSILRLVDHSAA